MPRKEQEPRKGAGEQTAQERVGDALTQLEQGIDALLGSEAYTSYLRTMARMPQYSFANLILIHSQRPDATLVAGYRRWQQLGRQVKRGEQGIRILVPHKRQIEPEQEDEDERVVVTSFGTAHVFDISQTEGEPLPEPPRPQVIDGASEVGMRLYVDLLDYLDLQGISVAREQLSHANGYYQPLTNHIAIGYHVDGDQATKTLAHETAHYVAGHGVAVERQDAETVAESAAFVVLSHYGLDSSGYSFPYVSHWARDRQVFKRNLDAVQRTAHTIIRTLEGEAEQVVFAANGS